MQTKTIYFNTKGHDDFIDFIKAYAILCVLFGHTFVGILDNVAYGVWAGMQVPLFILIQAFHFYKKDSRLNIPKILKRIFLPFFIIQIFTFLVFLLFSKDDYSSLLYRAIDWGGYGPGSYFPWVYFQIALLLPFFLWVLNKLKGIWLFLFFLVLCEGCEILFSYLDPTESIYRLLSFRYFFLIFLGWMWVKNGIRINVITIVLSLISLLTIIYFEYFNVNDQPWFFNTDFRFHRWPCYFFVANSFSALLYLLWCGIKKSNWLKSCSNRIAQASYDIFLIQMSLIAIVPDYRLSFIGNDMIRVTVYAVVIWWISISSGILLLKVRKRIQILH